jgi:hypothetical protein
VSGSDGSGSGSGSDGSGSGSDSGSDTGGVFVGGGGGSSGSGGDGLFAEGTGLQAEFGGLYRGGVDDIAAYDATFVALQAKVTDFLNKGGKARWASTFKTEIASANNRRTHLAVFGGGGAGGGDPYDPSKVLESKLKIFDLLFLHTDLRASDEVLLTKLAKKIAEVGEPLPDWSAVWKPQLVSKVQEATARQTALDALP